MKTMMVVCLVVAVVAVVLLLSMKGQFRLDGDHFRALKKSLDGSVSQKPGVWYQRTSVSGSALADAPEEPGADFLDAPEPVRQEPAKKAALEPAVEEVQPTLDAELRTLGSGKDFASPYAMNRTPFSKNPAQAVYINKNVAHNYGM